PENLDNPAAANYRFLNGSAASAVCPDRSREIRQKHLGEILASQTPHPSIEKPCSMGRPSRRPTAIQAALRRRRAGDVWLGRSSKVWMRSNCMQWSIRRGTAHLTDRRPQFAVCSGLSVVEQPTSLIGALNSPHDKSADERQSLETKPISRGTESSNPVPSSGESAANLTFSIRAPNGMRGAR